MNLIVIAYIVYLRKAFQSTCKDEDCVVLALYTHYIYTARLFAMRISIFSLQSINNVNVDGRLLRLLVIAHITVFSLQSNANMR